MTLPASTLDPVGEALHLLRMNGVFYCRSEFTEPWGLELPPFESCMMFHVVTSGRCRLEVDGVEPCHLQPGDLALVSRGEGHRLVSAEGVETGRLFDLPRTLIGDRYELLVHGGGGTPATVVCGVVTFDHPAARHLRALLPKVILVDAWSAPEADWIQSTLRFIAAEARELRAGGETVITRLADILVIQAIRAWMTRDPGAGAGWLGALRDPQIGRAVALVHRDPARHWTVACLASEAGMSRSAFSARFTALVGEPAMTYVTRWKMLTARMWLEQSGDAVGAIAERVGYESEAAFSRAFKRFAGMSPGAARRGGAARSWR